MSSDKVRVESFDLTDLQQKSKYEQILNTYQKIREEFAYVGRNGIPTVTIWYVKED